MKLSKILLTALMLFSLSHAKHSFKNYNDMCEQVDLQECANNSDEVRNLQMALNADKHLNLDLKPDGKWGEKTKVAVKKFQEHYKLPE